MSNENKNTQKELLPALDSSQYMADREVWNELTNETQRLGKLIDSEGDGNELSPDEFKKVKELASNVREYVKKYRKSVTKQANVYKNRVEEELNAIGYDKIDNFMTERRAQHQKELSDRLSEQLGNFNQLVAAELSKTDYLKSSVLASQVSGILLKRFPKVNSGAKNNEVKKWKPIESVIHMSITSVDDVMKTQPIIAQLPPHSKTLRGLAVYLEAGNENQLTQVAEWLEEDKPLIQRLALKSRVETTEATLSEMEQVLMSNVDAETKLNRVRMLLSVYDANH